MEYFRIHVTYTGRTGKPVGIFGACHHLKGAGRLTEAEAKLFEDIDAWYTEHLPEPPIYGDGNPGKAITWFKDTPEVRRLTDGLQPLIALVKKYGIEYRVSRTTHPGDIIYEDEFQVATVGTPEESAGAVLVRDDGTGRRALLIRVRSEGFEVPKGHVEEGETAEEAAVRELHEETGLVSPVIAGPELRSVGYCFEKDGRTVHKRVRYYLATVPPGTEMEFDRKPKGTRELVWVSAEELEKTPLVSDGLRSIIGRALSGEELPG